jgi:hypothetical protein
MPENELGTSPVTPRRGTRSTSMMPVAPSRTARSGFPRSVYAEISARKSWKNATTVWASSPAPAVKGQEAFDLAAGACWRRLLRRSDRSPPDNRFLKRTGTGPGGKPKSTFLPSAAIPIARQQAVRSNPERVIEAKRPRRGRRHRLALLSRPDALGDAEGEEVDDPVLVEIALAELLVGSPQPRPDLRDRRLGQQPATGLALAEVPVRHPRCRAPKAARQELDGQVLQRLGATLQVLADLGSKRLLAVGNRCPRGFPQSPLCGLGVPRTESCPRPSPTDPRTPLR